MSTLFPHNPTAQTNCQLSNAAETFGNLMKAACAKMLNPSSRIWCAQQHEIQGPGDTVLDLDVSQSHPLLWTMTRWEQHMTIDRFISYIYRCLILTFFFVASSNTTSISECDSCRVDTPKCSPKIFRNVHAVYSIYKSYIRRWAEKHVSIALWWWVQALF